MVWRIEITATAEKQLSKIGAANSKRVIAFLKRTSLSDNPRQTGKALRGTKLGNLWRYRVGDYRIICNIRDGELIVLVLEIGHRRDIYR